MLQLGQEVPGRCQDGDPAACSELMVASSLASPMEQGRSQDAWEWQALARGQPWLHHHLVPGWLWDGSSLFFSQQLHGPRCRSSDNAECPGLGLPGHATVMWWSAVAGCWKVLMPSCTKVS